MSNGYADNPRKNMAHARATPHYLAVSVLGLYPVFGARRQPFAATSTRVKPRAKLLRQPLSSARWIPPTTGGRPHQSYPQHQDVHPAASRKVRSSLGIENVENIAIKVSEIIKKDSLDEILHEIIANSNSCDLDQHQYTKIFHLSLSF